MIPSKDFLEEEPPISIRTCPAGVEAEEVGCSPGHSFLGLATDSTGVLGNLVVRPTLNTAEPFDLALEGSLLPGACSSYLMFERKKRSQRVNKQRSRKDTTKTLLAMNLPMMC